MQRPLEITFAEKSSTLYPISPSLFPAIISFWIMLMSVEGSYCWHKDSLRQEWGDGRCYASWLKLASTCKNYLELVLLEIHDSASQLENFSNMRVSFQSVKSFSPSEIVIFFLWVPGVWTVFFSSFTRVTSKGEWHYTLGGEGNIKRFPYTFTWIILETPKLKQAYALPLNCIFLHSWMHKVH